MFFSHTTAAALLGLPLPRRCRGEPDLHISTIAPARAPRGRGVIGHKIAIDPSRVRLRYGFRLPSPSEIWVELGASLSVKELVVVGDALLQRRAPLCHESELADAMRAASGRPGIRRLREALPLLRSRTDSPMETEIRLALCSGRLPEPHVNYTIVDVRGRFVALADMAYPVERVAVEYDGDDHRRDPAQYAADIDRHWRIYNEGWTIVRINRTHLAHQAAEAVERVRLSLMRSKGRATP